MIKVEKSDLDGERERERERERTITKGKTQKKNQTNKQTQKQKQNNNKQQQKQKQTNKQNKTKNQLESNPCISFIVTSFINAPTIWAKSPVVSIDAVLSICINIGVIVQGDFSLFILIWTQKFIFTHV